MKRLHVYQEVGLMAGPAILLQTGMGPNPYEKRALSHWTVGEWTQKRFEAHFDPFTCDVLLEDGAVAGPATLLSDERFAYEGKEEAISHLAIGFKNSRLLSAGLRLAERRITTMQNLLRRLQDEIFILQEMKHPENIRTSLLKIAQIKKEILLSK